MDDNGWTWDESLYGGSAPYYAVGRVPYPEALTRALGRGTLPAGTPGDEEEVMRAAGFGNPRRVEVGGARVVTRTEDEVVAAVFSLSSAAPQLFGDRVAEFERDLRELLRAVSPEGRFAERTRDVAMTIWRP
ncbi:hypothetical protein [Plantactinospora sp. CA-290183]|uniref:hypothetical protein n=1 Tax=Plantactinospora sp. CA-290183 TaxID=3240006 RepID=UPI003D8C0CED